MNCGSLFVTEEAIGIQVIKDALEAKYWLNRESVKSGEMTVGKKHFMGRDGILLNYIRFEWI